MAAVSLSSGSLPVPKVSQRMLTGSAPATKA
jgi:hypothetical protein